ncbi:hypothetical protein E3E36_01975 [Thermococcus sp. M36]|uniref:hypothetical protein n=1 Tax=Thermococcus sp. M36 TaxID=1638261 RepID=UPI00143C2097|nr:hypothetical protein [Thermococcus sp. M36]NJE04938.1 hypothetical protein [Thermococcus sp. M36]
METADVPAILAALFFMTIIMMPFVAGGNVVMKLLFGILLIVLLVYLVMRVSELDDRVESLRKELENLRRGLSKEAE